MWIHFFAIFNHKSLPERALESCIKKNSRTIEEKNHFDYSRNLHSIMTRKYDRPTWLKDGHMVNTTLQFFLIFKFCKKKFHAKH